MSLCFKNNCKEWQKDLESKKSNTREQKILRNNKTKTSKNGKSKSNKLSKQQNPWELKEIF